MAGLQSGLFKSLEQLQTLNADHAAFRPGPDRERVEATYQAWEASVKGFV